MQRKLQAIQALNNMSKIKRTGPNLSAGIDSNRLESLAEHSYKVTYLCLLFSRGVEDVSLEKLLRHSLLHDWGESVLGDSITHSKSYSSYFDIDIRKAYKKAEGKAKEALLRDSGIKFSTLTNSEIKLFKFCDTFASLMELVDLKQRGYRHSWLDKYYKVIVNILKSYDYTFVNGLLKEVSEVYERGYMENKYLNKPILGLDH